MVRTTPLPPAASPPAVLSPQRSALKPRWGDQQDPLRPFVPPPPTSGSASRPPPRLRRTSPNVGLCPPGGGNPLLRSRGKEAVTARRRSPPGEESPGHTSSGAGSPAASRSAKRLRDGCSTVHTVTSRVRPQAIRNIASRLHLLTAPDAASDTEPHRFSSCSPDITCRTLRMNQRRAAETANVSGFSRLHYACRVKPSS